MSQQLAALRSLHSSTQRAERNLDRSHAEVEGLLRDCEGSDGQVPAHKSRLKASLQILRESRFKQFEQAAADQENDQFKEDQNKWEGFDFASHRLINRVDQYLQEQAQFVAGSQSQPTISTGVQASASGQCMSQDLSDSFVRTLTLLEKQQTNRGPVSGGSGDHAQATRLPKLDLKKFNGAQLKWKPFWDRFEVTVDENEKIVPVLWTSSTT